jgi:uncharacterized protein YjbJ (UPF0337 family)
MLKRLILASLFILALGVSSCEKEGPAERAGEKIDDTVEKAGEKIEEAGDKIKEKTE